MGGLFQRAPYSAVMLAIAMLSLAGIPPLPGFVARGRDPERDAQSLT